MITTGVRETSIQSYYQELPKMVARQRQVLDVLRIRDMTNREIMQATGLQINVVTPRCKELRDMGLVVEKGRVEDPLTKKTVTIWGLPDHGQLALFEERSVSL